eukprot:scaffold5510_cov166-Ochromonas_danica.AAC.3
MTLPLERLVSDEAISIISRWYKFIFEVVIYQPWSTSFKGNGVATISSPQSSTSLLGPPL